MKENIAHSIFDVMGSKETALTRSLLTILFKDKITLNRLIKFCFPELSFHFTDNLLKQTTFYFEKDHSKYGRTDIEISNEHIHLILEAKIGGGKISLGQANNPIMIAKREWDKSLHRVVIRSLYPVLQVHDPRSDFAMKYNKSNREDYVYQLGKKIVLKNPIIKRFSQASAIAVTFKEL